MEIERLREEIGKQIEKDGGAENIKVPEHIDVQNWEKFNKEDLRKLVVKTVADMEELDRQRREDFKKYEMQKKAEEDHKLAQMTPEEREKAKNEMEAAEKRHNDHEKLKHPGGRDQLEEVWEESDHVTQDKIHMKFFKTFFRWIKKTLTLVLSLLCTILMVMASGMTTKLKPFSKLKLRRHTMILIQMMIQKKELKKCIECANTSLHKWIKIKID